MERNQKGLLADYAAVYFSGYDACKAGFGIDVCPYNTENRVYNTLHDGWCKGYITRTLGRYAIVRLFGQQPTDPVARRTNVQKRPKAALSIVERPARSVESPDRANANERRLTRPTATSSVAFRNDRSAEGFRTPALCGRALLDGGRRPKAS